MNYSETVGLILKRLRNHRGLDQDTLAKQVGITRSSLSRIEHGKMFITLTKLAQLCGVLDVLPSAVLHAAETMLRDGGNVKGAQLLVLGAPEKFIPTMFPGEFTPEPDYD